MGVSKISGIAIAAIAKVAGTTASQYAKTHGITTGGPPPDDGATRVVAVFDDAYVSWVDIADDGDASAWEDNMYKAGAGGDTWDIVDMTMLI
jgi:hypothetical protein